MEPSTDRPRCAWANRSPLLARYHDTEWGVPLHDDRRLFEHLVLAGAQAGLSWETVLKKRENYRRAFHGFDPRRVARTTPRDMRRLLADPGIIRNRLKIQSAITNARQVLDIQREHGSLDHYLWRFTGGQPIRNRYPACADIPSRTPASDRMSRDLRRRGFTFVGPTICYAYMQATGMVNDHTLDCFKSRG
ncbi:MAG: DNA-3-methyladenine glycosylase I [Euryarchaeota archaeon]|nr:DNA-3-methyladenine glycosylase I [Euryarchaeota archaeon]